MRLVPYRLPEILAADSKRTVIIVEGEKDADKLWEADLVATTNPMGAGMCSVIYAEWLKGRPVLILPDNDSPGHTHAGNIASALHGVAKSVRVLELPELPEKGDVTNFFDAGGTAEELAKLARQVPEWEPSISPSVKTEKAADEPAVLQIIPVSSVQPKQVGWLWPRRIPEGKLTLIGGDPGLNQSQGGNYILERWQRHGRCKHQCVGSGL